jgi:hypothetical protein
MIPRGKDFFIADGLIGYLMKLITGDINHRPFKGDGIQIIGISEEMVV